MRDEGEINITDEEKDKIYHDYSKSQVKKSKMKKAEESDKERPEVNKVVTGEVIERKRGFFSKTRSFLGGDDAHNVGAYILYEVAIPALKDLALDMLSKGGERALFGEVRSPRRRYGGRSHTDYDRPYRPSVSIGRDRDDRPRDRELSTKARRTHDFREVVLADRGDAEDVLAGLVELIDSYDVATVQDFYSMVGVAGSFTDAKWGWTDLRGARIASVRGGWLLDLPATEPID